MTLTPDGEAYASPKDNRLYYYNMQIKKIFEDVLSPDTQQNIFSL